MGRHSEESTRPRVRLVVVGLLVAIGIGIGIGVGARTGAIGLDRVVARLPGRSSTVGAATVSSTRTPRSGTAHPAPSAAGPSAATSAAAADTAGATAAALTACVRKQAGAAAVVDAAVKGAADWGEHLTGQTDLQDGSRSLTDVEHDMWVPTRSAGPGDVSAFVSAKTLYDALPGCVAPGVVPASSMAAPLTQCLARQGRLDTYLAASTAVMTDWGGHLQAMARHSAGQVDSAAAQADWLRRWGAAPEHLDPYAAAAAALTSAPACPM